MLLREALTASRSAAVPSALVMLVVAAMCFAAVATVGRQAAVEAAVAEELAGPQARTLTITDTGGSNTMTGPTLNLLTGLKGTSAVIGRESPVDAFNGVLGEGSTPVAVVEVHGTLDVAVDLVEGRLPSPGEVIVPTDMLQTLRLATPAGHLKTPDGGQWAVVGSFAPRAPFDDLGRVALAGSETTSATTLQQLRVVADSVENVTAVRDATLAVVDIDPTQVQVATPAALNATNRAVTGQLAGLGRSLLFLILGVGAFFVTVVVLADVLVRRRDLGRRRTLGITRTGLVSLVALRTTAPALIGSLLGSLAGHLIVARQTAAVPLDFTLAVAVLATVTAAVACLPPAAYAATRDPVEVMRTP